MNLDRNSHVRGKLCPEVAPSRPMTSYPDTLRQALSRVLMHSWPYASPGSRQRQKRQPELERRTVELHWKEDKLVRASSDFCVPDLLVFWCLPFEVWVSRLDNSWHVKMAATLGRGILKRTTGITGLKVHPDPIPALKGIYRSTLEQLRKLPETAVYRQHTEALTKKRLDILESEKDIARVEQKLGCGQLEEAILVAERELNLSHKMEEWKPWEPLVGEAPANQWKWPWRRSPVLDFSRVLLAPKCKRQRVLIPILFCEWVVMKNSPFK